MATPIYLSLLLFILATHITKISCSDSSQTPLVSIVLTTFNRDDYLDLTLASVLNQTYTNFELLIIDDGSHNARTFAILLHYMHLDPRVKVHLRHTHTGLVACRNHGISLAQSDLVAIVEDDDIIHPERIQKQVEVFLSTEGVGVLSTGMVLINEKGEIGQTYIGPPPNKEIFRLVEFFENMIA